MRQLFLVFLSCFLLFGGACLAHLGPEHLDQYKMIFNGFGGGAEFEALAADVNKTIDVGLPEAFSKHEPKLKIPGNHRILGHAHALNANMPKDVLNELLAANPGQKEEIFKIISECSKRLTKQAQLLTGLPKAQASAFVSIIHNIHLLGDYEPGNKLVSYVLKPEYAAKNIVKECEILFKNDPKSVSIIRNVINTTVKNTARIDPQIAAARILDAMASLDLGGKLNACWGNTLKMRFSPIAAERAAAARARRTAKTLLNCSEEQVKSRQYPLKKEMFNRVSGKGVMKPALLTPDGRLIIPLKTAAKAAGNATFVVVAFEAGIATYRYVTGSIGKGDFEDKLAEAAIKGATVGACTAVAVVLGSNPFGLVVLGVGFAAYEITDIAIEVTKKTYLSTEDLEAFGVELDSVLSMSNDSVFAVKFDTPLSVPEDTPFSVEHDTPFDLR